MDVESADRKYVQQVHDSGEHVVVDGTSAVNQGTHLYGWLGYSIGLVCNVHREGEEGTYVGWISGRWKVPVKFHAAAVVVSCQDSMRRDGQ